MKPNIEKAALIATMVAFIGLPVAVHAQIDRFDSLANSPMAENRPTPATAKLLRDELLFQRAAQTYLWALPLINTLGMKVGSEKVFGSGLQHPPGREEASRRQDVGDDAEFRRHLRDELHRRWPGRPNGARCAGGTAGHFVGLLAATDSGTDHRRGTLLPATWDCRGLTAARVESS